MIPVNELVDEKAKLERTPLGPPKLVINRLDDQSACSRHFETMVETIDIYRGVIVPGFLRWCRISSYSRVSPVRGDSDHWSEHPEMD